MINAPLKLVNADNGLLHPVERAQSTHIIKMYKYSFIFIRIHSAARKMDVHFDNIINILFCEKIMYANDDKSGETEALEPHHS